jgi:hypothetical protein
MKMKKYITFICKSCQELTWTRSYTNDEEYFEIMDNINPEQWEIKLDGFSPEVGAQPTA